MKKPMETDEEAIYPAFIALSGAFGVYHGVWKSEPRSLGACALEGAENERGNE